MLPTHLAWGWKGSRRTRQPPLCRARGSRRLALLHGHASLHSFPKLKNRNKNQTEGVGRGLGTWHRGQVEPTGRRAGLRSRRTPAELQGPSYNEQPENTVFNNEEIATKNIRVGEGRNTLHNHLAQGWKGAEGPAGRSGKTRGGRRRSPHPARTGKKTPFFNRQEQK